MKYWPPPPAAWMRVHGTLCVMWACLMVPSVLWWKESLVWVIIMSCYANFAGSMASLQAARADCNSPSSDQLDQVERLLVAHDAVVYSKLDELSNRLARVER